MKGVDTNLGDVQSVLKLTLPTPFTVRSVERENYRTVTVTLNGSLDAIPGQFVMAWLPRFDEKPFSLVNADPITLMVTEVEPFSQLIQQLQRGDHLWLRGPFGQGYQWLDSQKHVALVGGGYGVAPLLWLAKTFLPQVQQINAIIGARTAVDLLYLPHFEQLARQSHQVVVTSATEDGSAGIKGRVTDALLSLQAEERLDGIFACGPHGMLAALQTLGESHAIPCQLSWEAYMRCGIGICGACEHEGKVLCLDGPVLTYSTKV